jgi:anti-sigma B factor antagonist
VPEVGIASASGRRDCGETPRICCGGASQADCVCLVEPRCSAWPLATESYRPFDVTVQRDDAVATVVVSGELDLATVPQLSATVAEHGDVSLVVLDLTAVTFIDSTGVRVLIEADRACARSGSRLAVLAGDGPARRLLGLCKLDGRLALVTDHPAPAAEPVRLTHARAITAPRPWRTGLNR